MKKMGIVVLGLFIGGIAVAQPTVSLSAPTSITSTGFTLNGTVNNNGAGGGTVSRFIIGFTSGVYNDSSGTNPVGSTSSPISGSINTSVNRSFPNTGVPTIQSNTVYYYKLTGKSSAGYSRSTEGFFRTLPKNPTGLTVSGTSITDSSLTLTWNNTGSLYRILKNTTGNATNSSDGSVIYEGTSTSLTVKGLNPNTTYYFTIYARSSDATPVFSASSLSVSATTLDAATPVELVSFNYTVIGENIRLNWETKTETNNFGWEIEKTPLNPPVNGGTKGGWKNIGFVAGKGTTTEKQAYTFSSRITNHASRELFRLKQIDHDGNFAFSNILSVNLTPDSYNLSQNYPNPFNPKTTISYQLTANSFVSLVVYDLLGKEVRTLVNKNSEAGNYSVDFDATDLPSGIYFYKLTAGNFSEMKKMMVVK